MLGSSARDTIARIATWILNLVVLVRLVTLVLCLFMRLISIQRHSCRRHKILIEHSQFGFPALGIFWPFLSPLSLQAFARERARAIRTNWLRVRKLVLSNKSCKVPS